MQFKAILPLLLLAAPACMEPDDAADLPDTIAAFGGDGINTNLQIPLVVKLYHDKNFGGTAREFFTDQDNLGGGNSNGAICHPGANFEDAASSIGIHPGPDYQAFKNAHNGAEPTVTVFVDRYFNNPTEAVTFTTGIWADLSTLGINDKISSIQFNVQNPPSRTINPPNTAATIAPISSALKLHTAPFSNFNCGTADQVMQLVESTAQITNEYGPQYNDSISWVEVLRGPNFNPNKVVSFFADPNFAPGTGQAFLQSQHLVDFDFTSFDNKTTSIQIQQ